MKYTATVQRITDTSDSLKIRFGNVRRQRDAFWRPVGEVEIEMPMSMGKPFWIGRKVELYIKAKD